MPNMTRRQLGSGALALLGVAFAPGRLLANQWPSQPIKLLVGGAAGSIPDTLARVVADGLSRRLGVPAVVENRPSAAGIAAMQSLARSEPDGHTLAVATLSQTVFNTYLYSKLPYDPLRELQPVTSLVTSVFLLAANATVPADTLAEVVAWSRKEEVRPLIAIPANGAPPHIGALLLMRETGLAAEFVPFRSGPDAVRAAIRGDVHFVIDGPSLLAPQISDGALKGIVITGPERAAGLPAVPTVAQAGFPGAECESWMGLVAPRGLADSVANRLADEIRTILSDGEHRKRVEALNFKPTLGSPAEFARLIEREHSRWSGLLQSSGLKLD